MSKAVHAARSFIFLGSRKGLFSGILPARVSVCLGRSEVEGALNNAPTHATWVSFNRNFTDILLERVIDLRVNLRGALLFTLTPPRIESIPALLRFFNPVFGLVEGFRWLPSSELIPAIMREDASDRLVGGSVDLKTKALTILRGNGDALVVPFSQFSASGDGTKPDFTRLGLTDYGRTVVLGDYEASADAILYELDHEYRRRLRAQRRQADHSFGASLTRLRKQRRVRRSEFGSVSAKEIARIERNEVEKPHARTIQVIADRLGVRPEEIAGY
jgi:hypothetical protein